MYYFQCDYAEGCHPAVLEKLIETNLIQTVGYGLDPYTKKAVESVKSACRSASADVHFLVGGTQTNVTVITAILRPHEGVLSADSGHIAVHETGAVEATGHKVLILPNFDGKIMASQVEQYCQDFYDSTIQEHMVKPGMVYISFPTETGTVYTKKELIELYNVCRTYHMPLFIDGARLGYGLASKEANINLPTLTSLCDIFYIGGTKCGALFGEAVIINKDELKPDFRYFMKQNGGLLAKGRLLGVQFDTLFTDNLYFDICRQAVEKAVLIRDAFEKKGVEMFGSSSTNQQFALLTNIQVAYLSKDFVFEIGEVYDTTRHIVRFCTSWATTEEQCNALLAAIEEMPA